MRVSFSQFDKFKTCPESYRRTYIKPIEQDEVKGYNLVDSTYAAIGTYVQHLFDCIIKRKFFDHKKMSISATMVKELEHELNLILNHELISTTRDLSDVEITRKQLENISNQTPLTYLAFTGKVFPIDISSDTNSAMTKKTKSIIKQVINLFLKNWEYLFTATNSLHHTLGITPDNCQTELKIEASRPTFDFIGYSDFLFQTQDGYVILDGKLNKNLAFAQPTQLYFYAHFLDLPERETKVGYVNYTLTKSKIWDCNNISNITNLVSQFKEETAELDPEIEWQKRPFSLGEIKGYCKYCPNQNLCSATKPEKLYHKLEEVNPETLTLSEYRR